MLPRFDLITTTATDENVLVCAVYAQGTRQAFAVARAAGYEGSGLWSLGQFEVANTTEPFTLPPHLAWDVRTHRAQAFRRGPSLCTQLAAVPGLLPPCGASTSAELLTRLDALAQPGLSPLRADLERDVQSAFPLQFMCQSTGLWAVPQDQPVRVRPAPERP